MFGAVQIGLELVIHKVEINADWAVNSGLVPAADGPVNGHLRHGTCIKQ
jgi:hypothetical protein